MLSPIRIWSYDSGHMLEHYPPEYLAVCGQTPTLIIVEQNACLTGLFSEHFIFGAMIFGADENQSTFGWLKQSGSGTVFWKENEGMRRSIIHAEGVLWEG